MGEECSGRIGPMARRWLGVVDVCSSYLSWANWANWVDGGGIEGGDYPRYPRETHGYGGAQWSRVVTRLFGYLCACALSGATLGVG